MATDVVPFDEQMMPLTSLVMPVGHDLKSHVAAIFVTKESHPYSGLQGVGFRGTEPILVDPSYSCTRITLVAVHA